MSKVLRNDSASFNLVVEAGGFSNSQIIVMLGENGTGVWPLSCRCVR